MTFDQKTLVELMKKMSLKQLKNKNLYSRLLTAVKEKKLTDKMSIVDVVTLIKQLSTVSKAARDTTFITNLVNKRLVEALPIIQHSEALSRSILLSLTAMELGKLSTQ